MCRFGMGITSEPFARAGHIPTECRRSNGHWEKRKRTKNWKRDEGNKEREKIKEI
jgi:hypothetical protein